jgi:hypothetical protein
VWENSYSCWSLLYWSIYNDHVSTIGNIYTICVSSRYVTNADQSSEFRFGCAPYITPTKLSDCMSWMEIQASSGDRIFQCSKKFDDIEDWMKLAHGIREVEMIGILSDV